MPKLSVVIPVTNDQPNIRECLESVLRQPFHDVEVIAVNGRSRGTGGDILDEYASGDPRIRVLRLSENVGPGRAMNAGANKANGEYLLFLNGGDTYLPDSLEAIATRLERTGNPDLLVFDHVRAHPSGEVAPSTCGDLLASAGDSVFTLRERPDMARLRAAVSNRAFRTRFWRENELAFLPGLYEDAPIAYEALISARSIACLDRACLEHRRLRGESGTVLPSRKHFDIFSQYASVYAYIEQRPELDDLRGIVFHRMIDHFLSCLERNSRVRPADRRVYFRRIKELYRNFRPDRVEYPKDGRGIEFRLVELGLYTPYAALKTAQRTRRGAKGLRRLARQAAGPRVQDLCNRFRRVPPADDGLAAHGARRNRAPVRGPEAIRREAAKPAPDVRSVWVVPGQEAGAEFAPTEDTGTPGSTEVLSRSR